MKRECKHGAKLEQTYILCEQEKKSNPSLKGLCDPPFTEEDLETCWPAYQTYLVEILNGEYPLEDAREDLRGLIGSKYDPRVST